MTDFENDIRQKAITARGAKHLVRRKRGCTLPSDQLTEAQKRKLNGEVKQVNLNEPIYWEDYRSLPKTLQEQYYNGSVERWGVGLTTIANMMGVYPNTLRNYHNTHGVKVTKGMTKTPASKINAFKDWVDSYRTSQNFTELVDQIKEIPIQLEPLKTGAITRIDLQWTGVGEWSEILRFIGNQPLPENASVRVIIESDG